MRFSLRTLPFLLLLAVGASAASAAQTQQVRTLSVRDGAVYIDGRRAAPGEVPASLRADGVQVQFSVVGESEPVFEFSGRRYRLEGRRLVDLGVADSPVEVVFRRAAPSPAMTVRSVAADDAPNVYRLRRDLVETPTGVYDLTGRLVSEEAARLARLGSELEAAPALSSAYRAEAVEQVRRQAADMAALAREIPELEMRAYLTTVRGTDGVLFERLQEEQALEARAADLALRARSLEPGARRDRMEAHLRTLLEEAFSLKQANRQREIESLEAELKRLRARLEIRTQQHDRIIDRRLRELLYTEDREREW